MPRTAVEGVAMEIDVNSSVLATRIYAALRERFFFGHASGDTTEAEGGEVLATIRGAIVNYVQEEIDRS
jgi:hypothetical protein